MFRPSALVIAGAVLMTAGAAHAQEAAAPVAPVAGPESSAVPWYQRFTTSTGVTHSLTGVAEDDHRISPAWSLNQRWGITVDVREARRMERLSEGRGDQTAVGAFYQFTPSLRVGGEVSVETTPDRPVAADSQNSDEPRAGVRIESAFRF